MSYGDVHVRRKALEFARSLDGVDAEVYVTAPGAEIDAAHPLVAALGEAHADVFGEPAGRGAPRAPSPRRGAGRGARRRVRGAGGARRHSVVLRRVGAVALRDCDRE